MSRTAGSCGSTRLVRSSRSPIPAVGRWASRLHPDGTIVVCDYPPRCAPGRSRTPAAVEVLVDADRRPADPVLQQFHPRPGRNHLFHRQFDGVRPAALRRGIAGAHRIWPAVSPGARMAAVDLVTDGLDFANGVTLSPDEDFLVVAETGGYRLQRIWLTGPRTGRAGGLRRQPAGDAGQRQHRQRRVDLGGAAQPPQPDPRPAAAPAADSPRKVVWALPERLRPKDTPTVWVQAYDAAGVLVHDLQTTHPRLRMVSGVRESAGTVWLGQPGVRGHRPHRPREGDQSVSSGARDRRAAISGRTAVTLDEIGQQ